jgi:uncharacterized protein YfbU (UPF0304 family)
MNEHALLTLTQTERLILANQYAILEALCPADRASYALKRRIIEGEAAAECASLRPARIPPTECKRTGTVHRRRRASGGVNRGGALTPW